MNGTAEKRPVRVSLYGAGHVGHAVSDILRRRAGVEVLGPYGRAERDRALSTGADVVVIATTSFLADVEADIRSAVEAGSNVLTTAEEAAYPWAVAPGIAGELDALARDRGVAILGAGLNPGFAFDALVLMVTGAVARVDSLRVARVVQLAGFSETILRRLGIGYAPEEFEDGVARGTVHGHIGFPQSMRVVAGRLGVDLERIERTITPLVLDAEVAGPNITVEGGLTGGFEQTYVGIVGGRAWFEADFTGHLDLDLIGRHASDEILVDGPTPMRFSTAPGFNPQLATPAIIANSVHRLVAAPPGWLTVGLLPPALPV